MKKSFIYLIFSIFLISLLNDSCTKEISIKGSFAKKLVLNGVLVSGEYISVHLSANITSQEVPVEIPVETGKIAIYENDILLGVMHYDSSGIYSLYKIPQEGFKYTLKAQCEGYPDIEATTVTPISAKVSINTKFISEFSDFPDQKTQFVTLLQLGYDSLQYFGMAWFINYKYYDLWTEDSVKVIEQDNMSDSKLDKCIEFYDNNDFVNHVGNDSILGFYTLNQRYPQYYKTYFPNDAEKSFGNKCAVFYSNKNFIGSQNKMQFKFYNTNNLLKFYQLSPELYTALRGIAAQEATSSPTISGTFITPVGVTGNVKGGLGYFGSCTEQTISF